MITFKVKMMYKIIYNFGCPQHKNQGIIQHFYHPKELILL